MSRVGAGVVIVGGGVAGVTTADRLRQRGYVGSINILDSDTHSPYDRPPLSKQLLLGHQSSSDILLRKDGYYAQMSITLGLGRTARQLEPQTQTVLTDDTSLRYDHLVIASGVVPRLPADWKALETPTVRTLNDALALRARWQQARSCTVIGGGFLGLEVAASATQLGLEVELVEQQPQLLRSVVGEQVGERIAALHRREGVRLHLDTNVSDLKHNADHWSISLNNGQVLETDDVVVSVGCTPNVGWLAGSGLDLTNGVACDVNGRTALPNVYAVGDIACLTTRSAVRPQRVEHWTNALETADAAARAIVGDPSGGTEAVRLPYFWSHQYGDKFQMVGDGGGFDKIHFLERPGAEGDRAGLFLYMRDENVVATLAHNWPTMSAKSRRLLVADASKQDYIKLAVQPTQPTASKRK